MASREVDHDGWVRSRLEGAPVEDLWPVDEAALAEAQRRRRRGRPVRAAGWACIVAFTGYAGWLGTAAAPRDAMVTWGTMGFVAPAAKAPASPENTSAVRDGEPVKAAAVSTLPIAAAVVPTVEAEAGAPDAGPLFAWAPDAGPLAGRALAPPEPRRSKPAAAPKPAATARKPAAPTSNEPDDPYGDVVSPQPSRSAEAYEPADL
jgi:hypothetical protein